MPAKWTADLIGEMHLAGVATEQRAEEAETVGKLFDFYVHL